MTEIAEFVTLTNHTNYEILTVYPYTIRKKTNHKNIKATVDTNGYLIICLQDDDKRHKYLLHRVIAEQFIPNPNNFPVVDHINKTIILKICGGAVRLIMTEIDHRTSVNLLNTLRKLMKKLLLLIVIMNIILKTTIFIMMFSICLMALLTGNYLLKRHIIDINSSMQ